MARKLDEEELLKITALTAAERLVCGAGVDLQDIESAYHDEAERILNIGRATLTAAEAHRVALWLKYFINRFEFSDPAMEIGIDNLERSLPTIIATGTSNFYFTVIAFFMGLAMIGILSASWQSRKSAALIWGLTIFILLCASGFSIGAMVRTKWFVTLRETRSSAEGRLQRRSWTRHAQNG